MQLALPFGPRGDLFYIRDRLRGAFSPLERFRVLDPISQLVKSLISSRTKDEVSWPAFWKLVGLYPQWPLMAQAYVQDIEMAIASVELAEDKAANLLLTLRRIATEHPDYSLDFLATMSVGDAHRWLESLDGVAVKVAASTLNFSTLGMASFVVDTHVQRVLQRYGLIPRKAGTDKAHRRVMEVVPDWTAGEFVELHRLMKKLGQSWCQKLGPTCNGCPLTGQCAKRIN